MPSTPIVPAALGFVEGVPYAEAFGDVYHSADGGLEQARHVFLDGNGLPTRWRERRCFTLIETGFGLGLNFLATWQAWRTDPQRPERLHYVAIEKHPFRAADLAQLHAQWPELAELSEALREAWPPLVSGFHRLPLDAGRVVLTLVFGDIADCLPQIAATADAAKTGCRRTPRHRDRRGRGRLRGQRTAGRARLACHAGGAARAAGAGSVGQPGRHRHAPAVEGRQPDLAAGARGVLVYSTHVART